MQAMSFNFAYAQKETQPVKIKAQMNMCVIFHDNDILNDSHKYVV